MSTAELLRTLASFDVPSFAEEVRDILGPSIHLYSELEDLEQYQTEITSSIYDKPSLIKLAITKTQTWQANFAAANTSALRSELAIVAYAEVERDMEKAYVIINVGGTNWSNLIKRVGTDSKVGIEITRIMQKYNVHNNATEARQRGAGGVFLTVQRLKIISLVRYYAIKAIVAKPKIHVPGLPPILSDPDAPLICKGNGEQYWSTWKQQFIPAWLRLIGQPDDKPNIDRSIRFADTTYEAGKSDFNKLLWTRLSEYDVAAKRSNTVPYVPSAAGSSSSSGSSASVKGKESAEPVQSVAATAGAVQ